MNTRRKHNRVAGPSWGLGWWRRHVCGLAVAGAAWLLGALTGWAQPASPASWVKIPPGSFVMGSPATEAGRVTDEGPQTVVTIGREFWMGKFEVSQREFLSLMATNPSGFSSDLRLPVERVTWQEAMNYCAQLTLREQQAGRLPQGYVYRLPTEAEWEYACRAGTKTRFSHGDDPKATALGKRGWCASNAGGTTHRSGLKQPNAWGLFDLHGNVWEWCLDWYSSYPEGKAADPKGPPRGIKRVVRGGCWSNPATVCRSANRNCYEPNHRSNGVGFRVVLAPNL